MARDGKLQKKIASKVGKGVSIVSVHMKKHEIMSAGRIKTMIKKYYADPEAEEKSDEEWAKETGVYPETIARFKAEIKVKNEKTKSKSNERKELEYLAKLLEMAREGKLQKEIASEVGKDVSIVSVHMKKHGIMSAGRIKTMLKRYYANPEAEEKLDEEWAKETGVYPETIARLKKELYKKIEYKEPEYIAELLEMAREGKSQEEIASKIKKCRYTVLSYMKNNGIMAAGRIKTILKEYYANPEAEEKTDEEWAKETGVYPDTIARFKAEIKETEYLTELLEMAREGKLKSEIASKVGKTHRTVSIHMKKYGIMSAGRIKTMLKRYYANPEAEEKLDEEWAKETGVYPETIARLKKELYKKIEYKEPEYLDELLEMAREGKLQKDIASKVEKTIVTVLKHMKSNGIMAAGKVKTMLKKYYANPEAEEKTDEEWAKETGVYPETITRLKKEVQEKTKKEESTRKKGARVFS